MNESNDNDDFESLMSDRKKFNKFVYTPLSEAVQLLTERKNNSELMKRVEKLLKGGVPEIFKSKNCGIMARQLATPNNENRNFITIMKDVGLTPVFLEYFEDKFTSNNKYKHSLGQLCIQNNFNKKYNHCVEKINIIDFHKYDGKKIKEIKTLWGESLIDFHKELFNLYKIKDVYFFNEIDWYEKNNERAIDFYINFFTLVTCYGILFENFLIVKKDEEGQFTKKIILPALKKVTTLLGIKPLIVPIESIDLEEDDFWYQHLPLIRNLIK